MSSAIKLLTLSSPVIECACVVTWDSFHPRGSHFLLRMERLGSHSIRGVIPSSDTGKPSLSPEERSVVEHFQANHSRDRSGRFIVPLPKKPDAKHFGESCSQAVRRFLPLEHSLHCKGQFVDFNTVMEEYFDPNHAEIVPTADLDKSMFSTCPYTLSARNRVQLPKFVLYSTHQLSRLPVYH